MGSFIRITSLVACVAGGIAAAVWLAQHAESPGAPACAVPDAPAWQNKLETTVSRDLQPPVVLVPKDAGSAPVASVRPETVAVVQTSSATAPTSSSLGWPIQVGKDELSWPSSGNEMNSPLSGPWLLPPQPSVADNIAPNTGAEETQGDVPLSAIKDVFRAVLGGGEGETKHAAATGKKPAASAAALTTKKSQMATASTSDAGEPTHPGSGNEPAASPSKPVPPPPASQKDPNTKIKPEGDGRLSLHLVDSDIREVLQLLSRGSGIAIMPSDSVQGKISASLPNVDFQTALGAILKSKGLTSRREADVIYVGTQDEFKKRDTTSQRITTRLYRPNYVRAAELQKLFTPLLTPQVGMITVTSPSGVGIGSDSATAGGDDYANSDVVLVRDYDGVLAQIDRVFQQVDTQPLQVQIEAMILSVKLQDTMDVGVDFEALRDNNNVRIVSGSPITSLASLELGKGLKVGYLDASLSVFVHALETVGDTNVIATPRILALNKMRAEILIGSQLGYVSTTVTETSTTQAVQFLEVGTQLRLRPFISNDGMIRMEVHPELSTGNVRVEQGLTLPDKEVTGVTTNIMARDGSTVIIGGLIREDLDKQQTQIPLIGSLPIIGAAFRQKVEKTDRREIIVLITPRIVCDSELNREGNRGATEFHHRQAVVAEKYSPFSNLHLCDRYIYLAQQAWAENKQERALHLVNIAIQFDPENRSALDLRADIVGGVHFGDHTGQGPFLPWVENPAMDRGEIAPWLLDGLDPSASPHARPISPQGTPGEQLEILPPPAPAIENP